MRNVTPTTPRPTSVTDPSSPDASRRRAETPTEFVGTTTVTGARTSARFARATASRNARDAALPYAVGTTVIGTAGSYGDPETISRKLGEEARAPEMAAPTVPQRSADLPRSFGDLSYGYAMATYQGVRVRPKKSTASCIASGGMST